MRDVLVGALASELKLDVAETSHRGHARELGAQAAAEGMDLVVSLGGDGTVNEVVNGLLHERPRRRTCRCWPSSPAAPPTSSPARWAAPATRSRRPREILDSLRAGRTRLVSLGTASATGTSTAPLRGTDPAPPAGAAADAAATTGGRRRAGSSSPPGSGFDAEVIARVEAQPGAPAGAPPGALYVREATSAFLLGRERRRPAMTLQLPGEPDLDGLFLCLVSNVSPWTYLGARPVNPSPEASFDAGLDVFALGRHGPAADAAHPAPGPGPRARRPRPRRAPPARPRGAVADAPSRPQGWQVDGDHLGTATGLRVRHVPAALRVVA